MSEIINHAHMSLVHIFYSYNHLIIAWWCKIFKIGGKVEFFTLVQISIRVQWYTLSIIYKYIINVYFTRCLAWAEHIPPKSVWQCVFIYLFLSVWEHIFRSVPPPSRFLQFLIWSPPWHLDQISLIWTFTHIKF